MKGWLQLYFINLRSLKFGWFTPFTELTSIIFIRESSVLCILIMNTEYICYPILCACAFCMARVLLLVI